MQGFFSEVVEKEGDQLSNIVLFKLLFFTLDMWIKQKIKKKLKCLRTFCILSWTILTPQTKQYLWWLSQNPFTKAGNCIKMLAALDQCQFNIGNYTTLLSIGNCYALISLHLNDTPIFNMAFTQNFRFPLSPSLLSSPPPLPSSQLGPYPSTCLKSKLIFVHCLGVNNALESLLVYLKACITSFS